MLRLRAFLFTWMFFYVLLCMDVCVNERLITDFSRKYNLFFFGFFPDFLLLCSSLNFK